jgi:hypothetical protein
MTDLVAEFEAWILTATPQDRARALKVIEKQTEMTVSALEDIAKNLMTMESNQVWKGLLEKRNFGGGSLLPQGAYSMIELDAQTCAFERPGGPSFQTLAALA